MNKVLIHGKAFKIHFSSCNVVSHMIANSQFHSQLNTYICLINSNHSFNRSISIDRNYGNFATRSAVKSIKWKINQFFVYLILHLTSLKLASQPAKHMNGDINQLVNFVSVNQTTQNATISTTTSNRIDHNIGH